MSENTDTVRSLADLAEMCGDTTTINEAALVRDALIARGLLDWKNDATGGCLATMSDDDFYTAVTAALAQVTP